MHKNKLQLFLFIPLLLALVWQVKHQNYICISLILYLLGSRAACFLLQKYLHKYVSIPINISQIRYSIHKFVKISNLLQLVYKLTHMQAPQDRKNQSSTIVFKFGDQNLCGAKLNIHRTQKMMAKYNRSQTILRAVVEVLSTIEKKYLQIHKSLPILIHYFQEQGNLQNIEEKQHKEDDKNVEKIKANPNSESVKQKYERIILMGKKIEEQVRCNYDIYGRKMFLVRVVWKLRDVYDLWSKVQEMIREGQKQDGSKQLLSQKNKALINTIQLAFQGQNLGVQESNSRVKNALETIDQYLNRNSEPVPKAEPLSKQNLQYYHINDPTHLSPHPQEYKNPDNQSYDKQKFKLELNNLILKGLEQRKASQLHESQQSNEFLETKIKYDENTKQYQVVDLDVQDNSDHDD